MQKLLAHKVILDIQNSVRKQFWFTIPLQSNKINSIVVMSELKFGECKLFFLLLLLVKTFLLQWLCHYAVYLNETRHSFLLLPYCTSRTILPGLQRRALSKCKHLKLIYNSFAISSDSQGASLLDNRYNW